MLELNMRFRLVALFFLSSIHLCSLVQSICSRGCGLALGSYYISPGNELDPISQYMNTNINSILQYNRGTITNQDSVQSFIRINVPFSCECINGDFLGHMFSYTVRSQDTYGLIASERYANLTTVEWIQRFNSHPVNRIPDVNTTINVTVNCSCGDSSISKDYGLFVTYTLRSGETLDSVSSVAKLSSNLMRSYNPDANFDVVNSLIYIPGRDENGNYPPLTTSSGD
ncbi:lysM domain receptor-like kinase 3 [Lactuca sativa]|uniref:lysM domain receptor-like kinase 3 n=1 Tax=Lactuca sativa TaxID=4236 RepID=UPI0022AE5C77|nr:lysM domain receptor-like kinase 3 [Lactuca sativa]